MKRISDDEIMLDLENQVFHLQEDLKRLEYKQRLLLNVLKDANIEVQWSNLGARWYIHLLDEVFEGGEVDGRQLTLLEGGVA